MGLWLDPDGKTLRYGREGMRGTDEGAAVGEVYVEVDGYWVWAPPVGGGFWESPHLRMVADYLDEANREWHASVVAYFESHRPLEP